MPNEFKEKVLFEKEKEKFFRPKHSMNFLELREFLNARNDIESIEKVRSFLDDLLDYREIIFRMEEPGASFWRKEEEDRLQWLEDISRRRELKHTAVFDRLNRIVRSFILKDYPLDIVFFFREGLKNFPSKTEFKELKDELKNYDPKKFDDRQEMIQIINKFLFKFYDRKLIEFLAAELVDEYIKSTLVEEETVGKTEKQIKEIIKTKKDMFLRAAAEDKEKRIKFFEFYNF
jgi:hypothetical protein